MAEPAGIIAPYLRIWVAPRATIRAIVDTDPSRSVIALAALRGALGALVYYWANAIANPSAMTAGFPLRVVIGAIIGAILGIIFLYIVAWVYGAFCHALGGVGTPLLMRAALAWPEIIGIVGNLIYVAGLLSGAFSPPHVPHGGMPAFGDVYPGASKYLLLLSLWEFIAELKTVAEVNRFSSWRSLIAFIITCIVLVIAAALIGLAVLFALGTLVVFLRRAAAV